MVETGLTTNQTAKNWRVDMSKRTESWCESYLAENTLVTTTSGPKTPDRNWTETAQAERKWGALGRIVDFHNAHGLCYEVLHPDGTIGCYDPTELIVS